MKNNLKNTLLPVVIMLLLSFLVSFCIVKTVKPTKKTKNLIDKNINQKDCDGVERWQVKTLTDSAASKIIWTVQPTTVKALTLLVQNYPKKGDKDFKTFNKVKRFGYEFFVYEVTCKIREFRREDDGDYHLVLMDLTDTTITMVGEIPNPDCSNTQKSLYLKSFQAARIEFEKYKLPYFKVMHGTYKITGVALFDKVHGQLGCAPNGIELHPIMDFTKDSKY